MSRRFFIDSPLVGPAADIPPSVAVVAGPEAHHLLHVLRVRVGDEITVFDGRGGEWIAQIERLGRSTIELRLLEFLPVEREADVHLTLAVALPKGDRQAFLVEKAVELGVARLQPLTTERSVAEPVERALERLRRQVIEASKQCGRNRLLEVAAPVSWREFAEREQPGARRLFAHLLPDAVPLVQVELAGRYCVAIGPEGGWTDDEAAAALKAGWTPLGFGSRILRVETAALAAAAWFLARGEPRAV